VGLEAIIAAATSAVSALAGVASLGWWLATRFSKQDNFFRKLIDEHAREDQRNFNDVRSDFEDVRNRIMALELRTDGQTHSGRFTPANRRDR
jgi:hypothetical protein